MKKKKQCCQLLFPNLTQIYQVLRASNLIFAHALIAVPDLPVPGLQSSWQDAEIRKPRLEIKLQN